MRESTIKNVKRLKKNALIHINAIISQYVTNHKKYSNTTYKGVSSLKNHNLLTLMSLQTHVSVFLFSIEVYGHQSHLVTTYVQTGFLG